MDSLLDVHDLTKRFGPITAVEGVSFSLGRGEVLGFLGPNGAGKTTTMRVIAGYLPPSGGRAQVCGFDVASQPLEVKRRLGYLPEGAPAYGDMTPEALLRFVADLHGLSGDERRRRVGAAVGRLELESVVQRPIETLSKGFRRRVGLAQAILLDPEVLILDEPTDGLDPNQKHQVRSLLNEMAKDKAIIVSTHILEEVEAVCTRAIVIADGRIVVDESPEQLQARSDYHNAVSLRLPQDDGPKARLLLEGVAGVGRIEPAEAANGRVQLVAIPDQGQEILVPIRQAVDREGLEATEIFIERGRLDEVFRQLTTGDGEGGRV